MRIDASGDPQLEGFDKWTLSIGSNACLFIFPSIEIGQFSPIINSIHITQAYSCLGNGEQESITLPNEFLATEITPNSPKNRSTEGQAMKDFCMKIFPNLEENVVDPSYLNGRSILAATNKEVSMLNDIVIDMMPGETSLLRSADELGHTEDLYRFSIEFLNSLSPTGFPPHSLRLKPGMPIMLLRNLNPRQGLCNGTKMIFEKCLDNKVLQCKVFGSERKEL